MVRRLSLLFVGTMLIGVLFVSAKIVKSKAYIWLPNSVRTAADDLGIDQVATSDVFVVVADHWESGRGERALAESQAWLEEFRSIADRHIDSFGRGFRYSWFYPIDNFDETIVNELASMVADGYGEIEVHWHHRHTDSAKFEEDLQAGIRRFLDAGALSRDENGDARYIFVHGNWSLDNSRGARYCGVNNEIEILLRNGAVADMTFPALGTVAQPEFSNIAYYAQDTPEPKSYSGGDVVRSGVRGEGLLLLQGPLGLDFRDPLILFEYGALDDAQGTGFSGIIKRPKSADQYFRSHRPHLWDKYGIRIDGKESWVFVKLHAHGMQHKEVLLGGVLDKALTELEQYAKHNRIKLHYVTAREMYNLVRSVEAGQANSGKYLYDFSLAPPPNVVSSSID